MHLGRALSVFVLYSLGAIGQHFTFKVFDQESGLTSLEISAVYQDRSGFLWVGTLNGLFRYEAGRFVRYGVGQGLASDEIHSIAETADGSIWIASTSGLSRFDGTGFEKTPLDDAHLKIYGASSLSTSHGLLYVATSGGVFAGATGQRFQRLPEPPGTKCFVSGVHADPAGRLWYTCSRRIVVYEKGRHTILSSADGVPEETWVAISGTSKGDVIARSSNALIVFEGGLTGRKPRVESPSPSGHRAGKVTVDHEGRLLVPTLDGLAIHRPEGWQYVAAQQGLPGDNVTAVTEDRSGALWLGTSGFGLVRWPGYRNWETWGRSEGLDSESIWAVRTDEAGTLWAATSKGVYRFTGARWEKWPRTGIPTSEALTFLFQGRFMWVGSYPHGLFKVDRASGRVLDHFGERELGSPWITSMAVDGEGRIWLGAFRRLLRETAPHSGRFERMSPWGEGARQDSYFSLIADRKGRIWAAGTSGLTLYDHGSWRILSQGAGLKSGTRVLAEAPDGAIWTGYNQAVGISRVAIQSNGSIRVSHYLDAEPDRSVLPLSIGFDRSGKLWVGTDHGVFVCSSPASPAGWRHYDRSHGLAWNDLNFASFGAGEAGDVWVGTNRGLSHYIGKGLATPATPSKAVITGAWFAHGAIPRGRDNEVRFRDRALTLKFTGADYADKQNIHFKYRFAGLDDTWIATDNSDLHMPKIPPGSYRFEVVASNAEGLWSASPATFSFRILPPWYQHPVTIGFTILLAASLVWGGYRWRLYRLVKRQHQLESMVEARTSELKDAKEKSEEASRLKSEFLARMSHEIRTPMNAILGMTGIVLDGHLNTADRENLEAVRNSGESLLLLLNDLLDISRIEAGRLPIERTPFSLRECVKSAVRMHADGARRKGLRCECSVGEGVPDWLQGDPLRVRQLLTNLLSNAVKFTEHGFVRVEVSSEPVEGNRATLNLKVIDSGIGIPESKLSMIREPFRQADGSTTRKYGGSGLGLAICDRLISMMGGSMYIESQPGLGSTFLVELEFQIVDRPAPASVTASALPAPAERLSILLAEDNPVNQKLALRLLTHRGHSVSATANGQAALDLLQSQYFDLILMDVDMPVMDGITATVKIRELEKLSHRHIPVIAVTANAMIGDRERCKEAGMDDFIAKPYKAADLWRVVEAYGAEHRAISDRS